MPTLRFLPALLVAAVAALLPACESADLGDCPPNSQDQQLAGRDVVAGRCTICHSSQLSGAARQDAPDDLNFDDLATVRDEAAEMYGEAEEGEMPEEPYPALTSDELESMRVWLACGAPDIAVP